MSNICEDAPCCGCCGTGVWGNNDPEPMDDYEYYGSDGYDDGYFPENDEDEDEDDDIDEGDDSSDHYPANEDSAMEFGLFGDC